MFILIALSTINFSVHASMLMKPTLDSDLVYSGNLLDGEYQSGVSNPDTILGFEVGARVASPAQITKAIEIHQCGQQDGIDRFPRSTPNWDPVSCEGL